jgi:uncharacterized MAPEG superfamily protein
MTSLTALLMFTAWTLLLVAAILLYRGIKVLGGTPINSWARGRETAANSPFAVRLGDAHANCIENLAVFAAIVLAAAALGKSAAIDTFAPWVVYARIAQSLVHLLGTTRALVTLRASLWAVQLVLFAIMLIRLF